MLDVSQENSAVGRKYLLDLWKVRFELSLERVERELAGDLSSRNLRLLIRGKIAGEAPVRTAVFG
jgi:hypothetical protein